MGVDVLGEKFLYDRGKTDKLALISSLIEENPRISRREISEITGYSPAFVTNACNHLLEEHLIQEVGVGHSVGGRKPIYLEKNADAGRFLCVGVESKSFFLALLDYAYHTLRSQSVPQDFMSVDVGEMLQWFDDFRNGQSFQAVGLSVADHLYDGMVRHVQDMGLESLLTVNLSVQKRSQSMLLGMNKFLFQNRYSNCLYLRPFIAPCLGVLCNGIPMLGGHGAAGSQIDRLPLFHGLKRASEADVIHLLKEAVTYLGVLYDPDLILLDLFGVAKEISEAILSPTPRWPYPIRPIPYQSIGLKGLCYSMAAALPQGV